MPLLIHADDYGLSTGINRNILEAADRGSLTSASIIPNGYAVDEALEAYRARPGFDLHVHLNFLEGLPLSPPEKLSFLVDGDGFFSKSFFQVYAMTRQWKGNTRTAFRDAIAGEIRLQVQRICNGLRPGARIGVDSHQHIHMIPLFFEALMSVAAELRIDYIRIPRERYLVPFRYPEQLPVAMGANFVKVQLLNRLSAVNRTAYRHHPVHFTDHFIGVLFTGKMNERTLLSTFGHIRKSIRKGETLEVLFHPGGADKEEAHFWDKYPALLRYYFSTDRERERQALCSPRMADIVRDITKTLDV